MSGHLLEGRLVVGRVGGLVLGLLDGVAAGVTAEFVVDEHVDVALDALDLLALLADAAVLEVVAVAPGVLQRLFLALLRHPYLLQRRLLFVRVDLVTHLLQQALQLVLVQTDGLVVLGGVAVGRVEVVLVLF